MDMKVNDNLVIIGNGRQFNLFPTDYQKVVCDRAHSSVGQNDPNDDQVAASADDHHDGEEHGPK